MLIVLITIQDVEGKEEGPLADQDFNQGQPVVKLNLRISNISQVISGSTKPILGTLVLI